MYVNYVLKLHAMKVHGESVGIAPPFLALALDESEWSASCPGRLTAGDTAFSANWIAYLMGLRAGLDVMEKRKYLSPSEIRT
jgi:hypothetical protein